MAVEKVKLKEFYGMVTVCFQPHGPAAEKALSAALMGFALGADDFIDPEKLVCLGRSWLQRGRLGPVIWRALKTGAETESEPLWGIGSHCNEPGSRVMCSQQPVRLRRQASALWTNQSVFNIGVLIPRRSEPR